MEGLRNILIADDDSEIRNVLRILLEGEGFSITEAVNGLETIEKTNETVDLIILDVMMPGKNGYLTCNEIRERYSIPILFLTAKSQESDKTIGFSAGGDDYLVKPFSSNELMLRVKALLRRYHVYGGKEGHDTEDSIILYDELIINKRFNEVIKADVEIQLTDLEYRILHLLGSNRGKIFSVQNIYESVWSEPYFYTSNNTVMVHIRNLRRKIEDNPQNPKFIKNVWGKGYRVE